MAHLRMKAIFATCAANMAVAVPIYWTNWTGSDLMAGTGFQGQGTLTTPTSSVTVTYTNLQGIGFYQANGGIDYWQNGSSGRNDAISPYTSSLVDNSPTGTDIIALSQMGDQTLQFSQMIANPVFSFVSLNGNGYAFLNQDFEILSVGGVDGNDCGYWGCGGVTKTVVDLGNGNFQYQLNSTGGEPHGTIRFVGAFDQLTWRSSTNEHWNGFTVGVQGTAAEVFVPEPATMSLLGLGLTGLGVMRRRKRLSPLLAASPKRSACAPA